MVFKHNKNRYNIFLCYDFNLLQNLLLQHWVLSKILQKENNTYTILNHFCKLQM